MMLEARGRVVMVSGATRGIGRAIAEVLWEKGYSLSLGARDPDALGGFAEGRDAARLLACRFDALARDTHAAWIAQTAERFGRIDALVNNAGISDHMSIEQADDETLDRLFAVNVKAPLSLTRLVMPHLERTGAGRIVNVASLSGKRVPNDNAGYAMSKFALMALTHATRRLGWDKGVRCTALCPGFVRTDMTAGVTSFARDEMIDPRDLAELAATVIALPNNAAVAEVLVNCRLEDML
jgi:NADP-dependent 3-hydroxy acid dehydrogenase YdfG